VVFCVFVGLFVLSVYVSDVRYVSHTRHAECPRVCVKIVVCLQISTSKTPTDLQFANSMYLKNGKVFIFYAFKNKFLTFVKLLFSGFSLF